MLTKCNYFKYKENEFSYGKQFYMLPYDTPEDFYIEVDDNTYLGHSIQDNKPSDEIISKITSISIEQEEDIFISSLPDWIYEINNLVELSIPISLLHNKELLSSNTWKKLKSLSINSMLGLEDPKVTLDCNNLIYLEKLRIFPQTVEIVNTSSIKKLRYFRTNLNKAPSNYLQNLSFLETLECLELNQVQKKISIDSLSKANLVALDITNFRPEDNLLDKITNDCLKYLRINRYNQAIDITALSKYPQLEELIFVDNKIDNLEKIHELNCLKSLSIVGLKHSVPDDVITLIKQLNLERTNLTI